jgi:hypothetical protein
MVKKKRPSLGDRMSEMLAFDKRGRPIDLEKHIPEILVPRDWRTKEEYTGTRTPYQDRMIEETRVRHADTTRSTNIEQHLPNGQTLYWNEHAQRHPTFEAMLKDEQLIRWANQWTQRGGNRYAELLYADRLWIEYGFWENSNITPVDMADKNIPWSDYNHYFNWKRWKAEYNKLGKS